tara:strand:- start:3529 stop:4002 length:474 start_codon:yes stop_codon:yes gene_type:complete
MACVRSGSLVECVVQGILVLKAVDLIRVGDVLHDPRGEDHVLVVLDVHRESLPEVDLFQVFGLQCAGPQVVLFDGGWHQAETLQEPLRHRWIDLVGFATDRAGCVVVDGVVCRGLNPEALCMAKWDHLERQRASNTDLPSVHDVDAMCEGDQSVGVC